MDVRFTPAGSEEFEAVECAWSEVFLRAGGYRRKEAGILLTGTSALEGILGKAVNSISVNQALTDRLRRSPHSAKCLDSWGKEITVHLLSPGLACTMRSGAILALQSSPIDSRPRS
jgi:hypothetical protein